ncbi:MAG: hypothetical protein NZ570_05735 [Candidatus Caldarchaeum sp.]|nr:hypothetical protein [Candidatus Caldarchaeum sp.]MDW8358992.1 hypothetical protein [Candidatus Caldarchaeum sp.]
MRRLVEGCYVVDVHGDFYAVKGLIQPPGRVYAVPRMVNNAKLKNFDEAWMFVERHRPEYLFDDVYTGRKTIAVPEKSILRRLYPTKKPEGPPALAKAAEELAEHLERAGLDWGFSGSLLTSHADESSDIDLVVYGDELKAYEEIKRLRRDGLTEPVSGRALETVLRSRRDSVKAREMAEAERRKFLTGVFNGFLYTMKIVPQTFWESWEETRCIPLKHHAAVVKVVDDSLSFCTPGRYLVEVFEGEDVREIIFFRSRFAEMAGKNEKARVRGVLEKVVKKNGSYLRLNVGLDREDYIEVGGFSD